MVKGADGVARRYARALLDVAPEKGDRRRCARSCGELAAVLASSPELRTGLVHPGVPAEKKTRGAGERSGARAGPRPLLERLVALLAEQRRIELLPAHRRGSTRALWNARAASWRRRRSSAPLDGAGGQPRAVGGARER